jgi:SurA N-terminal domain
VLIIKKIKFLSNLPVGRVRPVETGVEHAVTARYGLWVGRGIVLAGVLWTMACGPSTPERADDYLVRVGRHKVSAQEFLQAFELTKTAHPGGIDPSPVVLQDARRRLLDELTTELVLLARANVAGVAVAESELEAAVEAVRSDYPPGVFEQTLAEAAVPLEAWKKRMRSRLVMDKLVAVELQPRIAITPEEVAAYYDQHYRGKAAGADSGERFLRLQETIVADLGRRKLEEAFVVWVDGLKRTHPVEVNQALWAQMADSAPVAAPPPAGK